MTLTYRAANANCTDWHVLNADGTIFATVPSEQYARSIVKFHNNSSYGLVAKIEYPQEKREALVAALRTIASRRGRGGENLTSVCMANLAANALTEIN